MRVCVCVCKRSRYFQRKRMYYCDCKKRREAKWTGKFRQERRRGGGVQLASERLRNKALLIQLWKKMPQSKSLPNFIRFPRFDSRTCFLTVLDKFPTMQFKKGNCLSIIAVYNIRDANTPQHNLSVLLLLRFYCNMYSPGRMGL